MKLASRKKRRRMSRVWLLPDDEFISLVKSCSNAKQILNYFGYTTGNYTYKIVFDRIKELNIDTAHFTPLARTHSPQHVFQLEQILVENCPCSHQTVRRKIHISGILGTICNACGTGSVWNGKKLVLQIDHINGINNDNRIENLQLLCPNCHSQTDTFTGRNKTHKNNKK